MKKININERINNLSPMKKFFVIVLLLLIFGSLFYLTSLEKIQKKEFIDRDGNVVCIETYIDGELNSSPCEVNVFGGPNWNVLNASLNN